MECQGDPLLSGWYEQDKAGLVALFLLRKYERGLTTSVTASICLHFSTALRPTGFLDGPVLEAARTPCKLNPKEIRDLKDQRPSSTVKMATCQSIHTQDGDDSEAEVNWATSPARRAVPQ